MRNCSILAKLSAVELEELLAPIVVCGGTLAPTVALRRCDVCREWMPARSREHGQCGACGAFLPRVKIIPAIQSDDVGRVAA